jgi:hypothetical protein
MAPTAAVATVAAIKVRLFTSISRGVAMAGSCLGCGAGGGEQRHLSPVVAVVMECRHRGHAGKSHRRKKLRLDRK